MMQRAVCFLAVLLAVLPLPAAAESCAGLTDGEARLACYDRLADCVTHHEPDERLACYDAAQASPSTATAADDKAFPVPGKPPEDRDEPTELVARIVKVDQGPRGLSYLTLDNGQVWRELSRNRVSFEPGAEVTISSGILGSVNLRVDGRSGYVKVRRVQ